MDLTKTEHQFIDSEGQVLKSFNSEEEMQSYFNSERIGVATVKYNGNTYSMTTAEYSKARIKEQKK